MEQQLILERYRPLDVLGTGGYGTVVLAYDTRMQRRVAIKRLPFPSDRSGRSVTPAGLAEARTSALLNHPNIITVHEWDADEDEAFIIMEHIDGASVAELLDASGGPLTPDEAAAVLEAVAHALAFAHENGVLHLDIKPENVLVTRDGRVKVTDFGVAALSSAAGHGHGAGGTLGHMPIEQLRGDELDERTDVWAFAVLAYELLADANPFLSESFEGSVFKAEVIEPPAPSEFNPEIPPAVDDILLAAVAVDPDDRYQDLSALADRLLPLLGDPERGRSSLGALAEELSSEEADQDASSLGLWDQLAPYSRAGSGLGAAAVSAWLAWTGLSPFGLVPAAGIAGASLAALAGALAPGLGLGVGLGLLVAGLARAGMIFAALGLFVVGAGMWWAFGRRGSGLLVAFAGPALGAMGIAPLAPLLAGFLFPPLRAAALSLAAAALVLLASAASGFGPPFTQVSLGFLAEPWATATTEGNVRHLLSNPAPLTVLAAWTLAGAVTSLACHFATRPAALFGLLLGSGTMLGGYLLADTIWMSGNESVTWAGTSLLSSLGASSILMVLVVAAGPPTRAEEE